MQDKTLFNHLKMITSIQDVEYFKSLTDRDKKTFSSYMILRYLSMNNDWTETINELQSITTTIQLKPELVYQLLISIIPPSQVYLEYVKSKNENKFNKELVALFMKHFEVSENECFDYLNILYAKNDGEKEISKILQMYGIEEKEIKKMLKVKEK